MTDGGGSTTRGSTSRDLKSKPKRRRVSRLKSSTVFFVGDDKDDSLSSKSYNS